MSVVNLQFVIMRYVFLFFVAIQIHLILFSYAQNKTNLKIKMDSAVLENVVIDYNDGIDLHILNDSLLGKSTFNFPLNGAYGLLSIQYKDGEYWSFLVNQKPASLNIVSDKDKGIGVTENKNMLNPFDSSKNKIYTEYKAAIEPVLLDLNQLYSKHGQVNVNQDDSLNSIQIKLLALINAKKMKVFEKYPNEYFSFFMAKNMLEGAMQYNPNPDYLKELRFFMTNTYPDEFMRTRETEYLLETIDYKINALTKKNDIRSWLFVDDNGNKFNLKDIESEYILIDFWATWCLPCIKQLPELDSLSKRYPTLKLQIIGVNVDRNYADFKEAYSGLSKNWIQIFDDKSKIRRFLDVNSFPTIILLDKDRNIVVNSTGSLDKLKISELME